MTHARDLPDVEGWYNKFGERWHVLKTCAGNGDRAMTLAEAVAEGHSLCKVCCRSKRWYAAAMEAKQ